MQLLITQIESEFDYVHATRFLLLSLKDSAGIFGPALLVGHDFAGSSAKAFS